MLSFLQERLRNDVLRMKNESGVSLLESLLVTVVVGAIIVLMANIPNALGLISKSHHLSLAREIASKQIEDKRATNYVNLVNGSLAISDSRINLLPKGSGEVLVEDCDVAICTNGENIKQITVTINWVDNSKNQNIAVKTFIGEGGLNQ